MTRHHALLAILLLTLPMTTRAQDPAPGDPEGRVAAALEAIWVHGVTAEIARDEVGVEGLPFLVAAAHDPACERRDNAVAFLSYLAESEQVPSLLALLDAPPGPMTRPEDRRALLLVPTALGWMASRGVPEATDALLALTEDGPGSAGLTRAAATVADPGRFRRLLQEQAVFGLGLASQRQPLAARRLRELAEDLALPSLRDSAAGTLRLFEGDSVGSPRPLSSGSATQTWPGLPGDQGAPTPMAVDPETDVHEHGWSYANHPDVGSPMNDARLDDVAGRSNLLVGRSDFPASPGSNGEDVACCVSFVRSGSAQSFGSTGDGLDVIDDNDELNAVLNDPAARVKIVEAINWCGGPGSNIIGCAWQPGNGMAVVRYSNLDLEAGLWTHEYGHNVGLGHNSRSTRFIMYPSLNFTNDGIDGDGGPDELRDECAAFHSPSAGTVADITTRSDACSDVDDDDVQDDLDNCPTIANFDQADSNGDGTGDACDCTGQDSDGDGVADCEDNCPDDPNAGQADADGDLVGDACDGCPNDANKTAPGACGCGVSDADSDGDGTPDCNDGCPNDADKTAPGACGCGVSDADSDGDGTPDCNDGCPNDPNKTAPGACGCGVSDADSDGDGTPDCNDGCPTDANKTAPGECGCTKSEADSDGDGTPDCNDDCPADPNKTTPGDCGCGAADENQDGDSHSDCVDNCPAVSNELQLDLDGDGFGNACDDCDLDPDKTEPGDCGCGILDTDSDGDGTPDCDDDCPSDAGKKDPGQCGCGAEDTDSDGDGMADCNDGCVSDAGKTAPGQCGCGNPDTDSDGDGTADCNDGCPADSSKTAPGACGCGEADADSDSDGTPDCDDLCPGWDDARDADGDGIPDGCDECSDDTDSDGDGVSNCDDACPLDALKIEPGACGCGSADLDSDGDGTPDCNDSCPLDANKTLPGACDCGVSDVDSDGDLTPDCNDDCPSDPTKIFEGSCGCGVADLDSDGDGTADCNDACPVDPDKTAPGDCGCGLTEVDSDGDGTLDCLDACPDDANKTTPGACGCGVADSDSDGDGSADCDDGCPADANKTSPGACGCGVSDADSDGDGLLDCVDNCAGVANADQADEDGNGIGDACTCNDRGDVHPDGVGNGRVDLRDFVIGHRKVKGELAPTPNDAACGDAFPGTVTCQPAAGPESWCVAGDGAFDGDDLSVIRSQVAGTLVQGCASCALPSFAGSLRLPADVAPRGATDNRVDVADVIVLLRWAVGFGLPLEAEELLRGDVAPAFGEPELRVVGGDGTVDVGDVVLALRAAVALDSLRWPLRRLAVNVESPGAHVAVAVRSAGWPSWAAAESFELTGCDETTGGLDGAESLRGLVCVLDAGPGVTPGEVAALTYRAPEPVSPQSLSVEVDLVDPALNLSSPAVVLDQD